MGQVSRIFRNGEGANGWKSLHFFCPGCNDLHQVLVAHHTRPVWTWNGDLEKPVFGPSLLVSYPANPDAGDDFAEWRKERVCHSFIGCNGAQPGEIIFLGDCTHALAGKVVPIPELPERWRD